MAGDVSTEKKERKSLKDDARPSRGHMLAIWAALATALGSQGIPSIVRMLSNKPDVEDVQMMIASQTAKLTVQQNNAVEAIRDLDARLRKLSEEVSHTKALLDFFQSIAVDCLRKGKVKGFKPVKKKRGTDIQAAVVPEKMNELTMGKEVGTGSSKILDRNFVKRLQKVPAFDLGEVGSFVQQPNEE